MICECKSYKDIEFLRSDIKERIKETKKLKKELVLLVKSEDKEHQLYKCPLCNQMWQLARAWVNGNEPYLFKIPSTSEIDWLKERFQDPDELLDYIINIDQYAYLPKGENKCMVSECNKKVIAGLLLCHQHHVANLQNIKRCPKFPFGKQFLPYQVSKYEL